MFQMRIELSSGSQGFLSQVDIHLEIESGSLEEDSAFLWKAMKKAYETPGVCSDAKRSFGFPSFADMSDV